MIISIDLFKYKYKAIFSKTNRKCELEHFIK